MTPDLHWMAGVIDARGHIELNDRRGTPMPRVRVTTRHVPLLQTLADMTGVKVRSDDRGYERKSCGIHCTTQHVHVARQSASWTIDSARATIVLYAISPFMVARQTEAIAALRVGLDSYPPARGDTAKQMAALGWPLPSEEGAEAPAEPPREPTVWMVPEGWCGGPQGSEVPVEMVRVRDLP